MGLLKRLKEIVAAKPASGDGDDQDSRREDPGFSGPRDKEVADLPPERAAELAGHAPERVDT
jgi:hypothetical protein